MELWIRSQDKETLRLAETLDIYNATIEGEEKRYVIEESGMDLGAYATKERAIEVLDEIQKILNPMLIFKNAEVDEETLKDIRDVGVCYVSNDARLEQLSTYVYEMPEE